MNNQLPITFPLFSPGTFAAIREKSAAEKELDKLLAEREHLKHQVAGFKGWKTKRKNKNQ